MQMMKQTKSKVGGLDYTLIIFDILIGIYYFVNFRPLFAILFYTLALLIIFMNYKGRIHTDKYKEALRGLEEMRSSILNKHETNMVNTDNFITENK